MRFIKGILLLVSRSLILPSETLAASSRITRDDRSKTRSGTETRTHQDTPVRKPATGLGSDKINKDHGQSHDIGFFEATPANIKASHFGAAYVTWIQSVDKSSEAWRNRISEPDYFAKTVLDWEDDVNCGIAYNGCDGKPSCSEISSRIENRARARQICYIFDSFHHVSLISAQVHKQSGAAQAAGIAKARELASTFFWKYDPSVQRKCELLGGVVKAVIMAVTLAIIAAAPLFAPAELGALAVTEEIAVSEAAGVGEGATLVEVGDGIGASVSEVGELGEVGGMGEVGEGGVGEGGVGEGGGGEGGVGEDGGSPETGSDASIDEPPSEQGSDEPPDGPPSESGSDEPPDGPPSESGSDGDEGSGSTGDGKDGGTGTTKDGKKRVPGVKMPWNTKPSYIKNGKPKKIGWHRVGQGKTNVIANALSPFAVTTGGKSLEESICSRYPNARPEDLEKYMVLLYDRMLGAGEDYRSMIDAKLEEMNYGNGFGDNGTFVEPFHSILAETIYHGDYVRLSKYERNAFIEEPSKLEETITAHLINSLISVSLKTSMCYLHCTSNLDDSDLDNDKFIIKPEAGTVCQAQYWQNWDQTKQLKMFGLEELMNEDNHWGTDAKTFLTQSYKHWQWSRYSPDLLFPSVEQLQVNAKPDTTSGAAVPVCYSPQPIKDYNKLNNQDKALPCICGDEMGNETLSFFHETNFQSWVAVEKGKGLAEACQTSFEIGKTWPVQAYLTFCYFGWHFPVHADKHDAHSGNGGKHCFGLGADALCNQTESEVQEIVSIGGSNLDVNCHLCWQSDVGKRIKENQRHYVHHNTLDRRNKYNFEEACKKQMGKKKVCKM